MEGKRLTVDGTIVTANARNRYLIGPPHARTGERGGWVCPEGVVRIEPTSVASFWRGCWSEASSRTSRFWIDATKRTGGSLVASFSMIRSKFLSLSAGNFRPAEIGNPHPALTGRPTPPKAYSNHPK